MPAESLPAPLRHQIVQIARTPRLLVACDYDGTLAPFGAHPDDARPHPQSAGVLRSLAVLHETTAAVISGRALRDLSILSRLPAEVHLVGSHGSEFDPGFVHELDSDARELHGRLKRELARLTDDLDGVQLEIKPASIAVHVRRAERDVAERLVHTIHNGPSRWDGVTTTHGKEVVELAVVRTDKGNALDTVRHRVAATAAIFFGDDLSDEKAFARLSGPDVGVKVGAGETLAQHRVAGVEDVATILAFLLEERRNWLFGQQAPPIERLSMLADERSVALVTPDARLTWLCHPGPDAPGVFADLLGGTSAGHFSVRPHHSGLPLGQRYLQDTMTVETRWSRLRVTDYLEPHGPAHRTDIVRVIEGTTDASVVFAPRPEFGAVPIRLEPARDGLRVTGTSEPFALRSPGVHWEITNDGLHDTATATVRPTSERPVVLELRCGTWDLEPHELAEGQRRVRAGTYWSEWVAELTLPGVETDLVARSALTLRGLCNSETGGVLAAATTSLPEEIGGIRNWDYRYCWIRDAAMTVRALVGLGSTTEAERYLQWLHRVLANLAGPDRLCPLYTISGTQVSAEAVIDHLPGYAGSRPVRVGNLANHQVQLDVFGPVVELVAALAEARGTLRDRHWEMVHAMAEAVTLRWFEPDHGIWEERHAPRHRVYSRVMCWVTIDRAIRLGESFTRAVPASWHELRERIADDVLTHGWNKEANAFTAAYDGTDLDAASLLIGLVGLIEPADERFEATVTAVEAELRRGPTVYRYRRDDGLPGGEGGFHLCTAWLIEAYLLTGRRTEAEELFKQMVESAGPTGLLPEQYDPMAERSLGNHPQAYSHIGLIRCATLLSEGP
ncbi:trehalose-phosphatase [Amycolatopsis rhizosphaerae]|uniref:Trehalose-phosphatase n=1 Tax=Amycolatopsis rhizosphaerae TaxID=2053003 RepID=A0A558CJ72_9PSEU|nr:trehalose-phosphatase [Amycolatopsis rhizosphaerae]TVT48805.1 trehalose-phosphatase [Amycolatopsis rhizosphaerae]